MPGAEGANRVERTALAAPFQTPAEDVTRTRLPTGIAYYQPVARQLRHSTNPLRDGRTRPSILAYSEALDFNVSAGLLSAKPCLDFNFLKGLASSPVPRVRNLRREWLWLADLGDDNGSQRPRGGLAAGGTRPGTKKTSGGAELRLSKFQWAKLNFASPPPSFLSGP